MKRGRKGINLNIHISNKATYTLLTVFLVLIGGFIVYAAVPNPGHAADSISVDYNGEKSLQIAINEIKAKVNQVSDPARDVRTVSGHQVPDMKVGKPYMVGVYGVTADRGRGATKLKSLYLQECGKPDPKLQFTPEVDVNWPDGNAPHSAMLTVVAPPSGCIEGFTDIGPALVMTVAQIA